VDVPLPAVGGVHAVVDVPFPAVGGVHAVVDVPQKVVSLLLLSSLP
jgi:sirohydrochlorin ferrochelatase